MLARWALAFLLLVASPAFASPPFSPMKLPEAREQMKGHDQWLLVYLTATWCGPCQMMKKETWPDPEVVDWVNGHGLAVMVDVDQEPDIAKGLRYDALPTLVVLRGGEEVDRAVGRQSKAELLSWLVGLQSGRTSLDALREASQSGDGYARLKYAEALRRHGQLQQGFEVLTLVWDEVHDGTLNSPAAPSMTSYIAPFCKSYEPARAHFSALRDQLRQKLDRDISSARILGEWMALSKSLQDETGILSLHDSFEARGQLARLESIRVEMYQLLVANQRWAQAGRLVREPSVTATRHLDSRDDIMKDAEDLAPANPEEFRQSFRQMARRDLAQLYWALQAVSDTASAEDVVKIWRARDEADLIQAALDEFKPVAR